MPSLALPARSSPNHDNSPDSELEDQSRSSTSSSWKRSNNQRMSFKSFCLRQDLKSRLLYATSSSESQSPKESGVRSMQRTTSSPSVPRIIKLAQQIPSSDENQTVQSLKDSEAGGSFQPENPSPQATTGTPQLLKFRLPSDLPPIPAPPTISVMVYHRPKTTTVVQGLPMTETISTHPRSRPSVSTSVEEEGIGDAHHRKHICPEPSCKKQFNSPGGLRAHYVIHTGATPFRCPYPACGKEFNVISNMRRHFRAHPKNVKI